MRGLTSGPGGSAFGCLRLLSTLSSALLPPPARPGRPGPWGQVHALSQHLWLRHQGAVLVVPRAQWLGKRWTALPLPEHSRGLRWACLGGRVEPGLFSVLRERVGMTVTRMPPSPHTPLPAPPSGGLAQGPLLNQNSSPSSAPSTVDPAPAWPSLLLLSTHPTPGAPQTSPGDAPQAPKTCDHYHAHQCPTQAPHLTLTLTDLLHSSPESKTCHSPHLTEHLLCARQYPGCWGVGSEHDRCESPPAPRPREECGFGQGESNKATQLHGVSGDRPQAWTWEVLTVRGGGDFTWMVREGQWRW